MNKLSALMTIYNEIDFVDCAIRGCLEYVDHLVIVEGAYQETISLGQSPRSNDGTLDIIEKYRNNPKVTILFANEKTDKDQRNIGLAKIKELNPNGWMLIIDGDEVYKPNSFKMVRNLTTLLDKSNKKAAYFKSLTFVNNINEYCEQEFPRLFKITEECCFVNDNFMTWKNSNWTAEHVIKTNYIHYYHYSFVKKHRERFSLKKNWWETRFGNDHNNGKKFEYDWYIDDKGKISSPNHKICKFIGEHPEVIRQLYSDSQK